MVSLLFSVDLQLHGLQHDLDHHEGRPLRPDAGARDLRLPARSQRRLPRQGRSGLALHVPDPGGDGLLHAAVPAAGDVMPPRWLGVAAALSRTSSRTRASALSRLRAVSLLLGPDHLAEGRREPLRPEGRHPSGSRPGTRRRASPTTRTSSCRRPSPRGRSAGGSGSGAHTTRFRQRAGPGRHRFHRRPQDREPCGRRSLGDSRQGRRGRPAQRRDRRHPSRESDPHALQVPEDYALLDVDPREPPDRLRGRRDHPAARRAGGLRPRPPAVHGQPADRHRDLPDATSSPPRSSSSPTRNSWAP